MLRKLWNWLTNKGDTKSSKLYHELLVREDQMIKDQALLNVKIDDANKLVEEYKKKLEEPNKNFTVLDCFSLNDEYFLSQLHEIVNNKAFLFHMHSLKTDCLNAIIDGDAKTAIVRQGMLKGIDKVMHSLNVASKQYKEILESKENEQQLQVQA